MSSMLYVANGGDDSLLALCPVTGKEKQRIKLNTYGELGICALRHFAGRLWMLCPRINGVGAFCPRTEQWRTVAVGAAPVALARCGREMLCACAESDSLWRLSRGVFARGCMPTESWPCMLCAHGQTLWVGHTSGMLTRMRDGEQMRLQAYGEATAMVTLSDGSMLAAMAGDKGAQLHRYLADGTHAGWLALRGWPTALALLNQDTVLVSLLGHGVQVVGIKRMKHKGHLQCMQTPLGICRDRSAVYVLGDEMVECIGVDGRCKWRTDIQPQASSICLV